MGSATRLYTGYVGGYPPTGGVGATPAGGGSSRYPVSGGLILPGVPLIWYHGQDIDLLGNTTLVDAQGLPLVKNKGTLGAAWDVGQGSAPNRPLFRKIADPGKINNLSAIESNGNQFLSSITNLAIAQPTILFVVFKVANLGTTHTVFDGGSATNNMSVLSGSGIVNLYSGAGAGTQSIPGNTWEVCVARHDGATSFNRLNGSQSGNVNVGTNQATMAQLFHIGGVTIMTGMIAELALFGAPNPPPVLADIETYACNEYGITPQ